ncbi:MAG: PQQ-binding-like beta-propeller repeat protein, partial [Bryobacteraceae bacterium]
SAVYFDTTLGPHELFDLTGIRRYVLQIIMLAVAVLLALVTGLSAFASDWMQFRGPNGSGISDADTNLPVEFNPTTNVVWKTAVPPGHSSPSVGKDLIFLTAIDNDKLSTIAIDRATGAVRWRREAPRPRKQIIERPANSPVSATPVTDGNSAFVFFQDFGLLAYGADGQDLWRVPLGPFNNPFGHGSSPILAGNTLLMNCDQDTGSFLLAIDKITGRTRWRVERPHAQRGYSTPILYKAADGSQQVLVVGSYRLSGYDLQTGKEVWYIRRLPWQIKPTPVVAGDVVYFSTWAGESESGEQENAPSFKEAVAEMDTNKDGKLSKDEIKDPKAKARFDEYSIWMTPDFEEHDWNQFRTGALVKTLCGLSPWRARRYYRKSPLMEEFKSSRTCLLLWSTGGSYTY